MKPLRHLALLLLLPLALTARAEPSGLPTLEKISRTATIGLGHRESSVPFSYYNSKRQVVGYSHDLMLAAVERIRRELKLPALVIAGRQDPLVPLRRQEFTATLMPYGQFKIIEDAGHMAPLEQPEAVSDAVEAFLDGPMMLR